MNPRLATWSCILLLASGCASQGSTGSGSVTRAEHEALRAELASKDRQLQQLQLDLARQSRRADRLTRDAERLRADIEDAEQALVSLEAGLKGMHTRADAVSALADARILVARAAQQTPWRADSIQRARDKLDEAERHIEEKYFGSAVFFTARGRRLAEEVLAQGRALREDPSTRFVRPGRANVRGHPSLDAEVVVVLERGTPVTVRGRENGWVRIVTRDDSGGWIYGELLSEEP